MAAISKFPGGREIAYANIMQITKSKTDRGLIPNFVSGTRMSRDRTEPPVGSIILELIYNIYQEDWLVDLLYNDLVDWNDWLWRERLVAGFGENGMFVWGSDPVVGVDPTFGANTKQAAMWESGLDNSPMFDAASFDDVVHHMRQWDVGLSALFIADCNSLINLGTMLGRDVSTLKERKAAIESVFDYYFWDSNKGVYVNRRTDTEELNHRYSPTSFYPMIAKISNTTQVNSLIINYLTNYREFCCDPKYCQYGIPSISRSDPKFTDNDYWRGRVWAPMNFLTYLGLHQYSGLETVRVAKKNLAKQSKDLLLNEFYRSGFVYENYNSVNGAGGDVGNANPFYHWGALLAAINLIEEGYAPAPILP